MMQKLRIWSRDTGKGERRVLSRVQRAESSAESRRTGRKGY
jgi:hypothetical protein